MASINTVYACVDYFCVISEPPRSEDPQRGAHVLDIDLRLANNSGISGQTRRALVKRVHTRLADIETNDKGVVLEKRIDAIRVNDAGPTLRMWTTFKELNPRHLTLIGGMSKTCYFEPLRLMTTWNRLESIYLGWICTTGEVYHLPPFVLRTLKSLDLHMCLSMGIRAVGGAAHMLKLENLNLHTNDVGESAATLLNNFPSIKESLRCLSIKSSFFGYDYEEEPTGIRRILTECTKLTDVKLSLRLHHAVCIAGFLPPLYRGSSSQQSGAWHPSHLSTTGLYVQRTPSGPRTCALKFTVDREELSMPKRFFLTEICGEDEEPGQTYTPGVTVTLPEEEADSVSDDQDPVFDEDTFNSYGGACSTEAHVTDDFNKIDLDNLPGIGPHPNHITKKVSRRGLRGSKEEVEADDASLIRERKAMSVGDEALAGFEKTFAAKEELFKILRDTRPGIELV